MNLDNDFFTMVIESRKNGWTGLTQEKYNQHILWVANMYARMANPNHIDVEL